ncbi:MAG: PHP domain-containing protein, partial [Butyricicoccaceae bacterium]
MASLSELFHQYLDEANGAYLSGGEVCSVAVSHDQQAVLCKVGYDSIVPRRALREMENGIRDTYGLARVRISPQYQLEELTEEYIHSLQDYLVLKSPCAQGLLADSRWEIEEHRLKITMLPTGIAHLSTMLRQIPELIRTETGMEYTVEAIPSEEMIPVMSEPQNPVRPVPVPTAEQPPAPRKKPKPAAGKRPPARKAMKVKKDEMVLFGKLLQQPIVSIRDAANAIDSATIRGEVFFVEHKEIKSKNTGKEWVKIGFDVTDLTSSMRVSKFVAKEKADELIDAIKTGMYLTIQGKVSFDTYEKETILEPTGIVQSKKPMRMDTCEEKRVELHLHTNMSTMDGITPMKELMKRAKAWGHKAIAVTDHGVAQAFPDAMHAIERNK